MLRLSKKSKETVTTFAKRRPIATTMLCLGVFGLCLGGVTTGLVYGLKKDDAFTSNYGDVTKIEEIWNDKGYFDPTNLNTLLSTISAGKATFDNMLSIETDAAAKKTAADLKANNQNGQKEIVVTFGGLDWTPTFLSKTADGKDTILTLWMTNSSQLKGQTINGTTKFNSNGQSKWSSGWYKDNPEESYPSNMYGTSYIRAVTLNNGGKYATSGTEDTTFEKDPTSVFAKFTMDDVEGSLTDYIVEPARVQWQEYGQNTKDQYNWSSAPNENWSDQIPNSGAYMGTTYSFSSYNGASLNYAGKGEDNYIWRGDKIWLPSITETGYSDEKIGLWNTSTTQRQNSTYSWLRSGNYSNAISAYILNPSGTNNSSNIVSYSYGVRVALHLSLTAAAKSAAEAPPPTWADITTATDFAGGTGEESAPYEIATAEQLALLAKRVNEPNTHDQYASLYYKQTADIRLGGHDWQPIGIYYDHSFQGHYNGNGYKIQGITINSTDDRAYVGLFGRIENGGTIENIIMESGNIQGCDSTGSIAGYLEDSEITNCKSNLNIVGGYNSGGIVGDAYYGDNTEYGNPATFKTIVSNCYFSGSVYGSGDGNGGLVGNLVCAILKNSIFDGMVTTDRGDLGGLIGWTEEGYGIVSDCISKGVITVSGAQFFKDIGSLGGNVSNSSFTNCAAYGYIYTDNPQQTGSLVGDAGVTTITGCSFSGTCNSDDIAPFVADNFRTEITACYAWLNNDVKVYSDDTSNWAEYYGLAGSMNDGLPMQRSLFAIASVSPATTEDILAVFPADKGWKRYEAA